MTFERWVSAQHEQLGTLAQTWLSAGAASFSVWAHTSGPTRCLAFWPETGVPSSTMPGCVALIALDGTVVGELRLGMTQPIQHAQSRLESDAALLARWLKCESDLHAMTAALVEYQDHYLAVYELSRLMRRHLHIDEVMRTLARESIRLVNAPAAFTLALDDGKTVVMQFPQPMIGEAALVALFERMRANTKSLKVRGEAESMRVEDMLLVPIRVRETVMAALGLVGKPGGFSAPDVKLVHALAQQASLKYENVLLYQEQVQQARDHVEMDLARRVQTGLLPQTLPEVPGLEIFAGSRTALHVGGDFYDFLPLTDPRDGSDRLWIAVGDASGKGIPAALVIAMVRTELRCTAQLLPDSTPRTLVAQANAHTYDDFTEIGMLVTLFAGSYEPHTRQLTFSNAGHSPVIYCPLNGSARLLEADGAPLGVLPMSYAENQHILLAPGDTLVIATDGFSEALHSSGEMFGSERLLRLVEASSGLSAEQIGLSLFDVINRFSGGHAQDDQTLVVIKGH